MTVVLDTDELAPRERPEAVMAVFDVNEVPQRVTFADAADQVRLKLGLAHYGPGVHFMHTAGSGLFIDRTKRHVRQHAPSQVVLFTSRAGTGHIMQGDAVTSYRPGDVGLMETMRPYSLRQSARAEHLIVVVNDLQAEMSAEYLRTACERITASPLYSLVCSHFLALCDTTAELDARSAAAVGRASTQLVEAALLTAADNPRRAESLHDTLFLRMADYAERHLHDPELTPAQIAAAHFISLRQLYKVWDQAAGQSPHRWIMDRRIDRAGRLLAKPSSSVLPISWVARQCGFTNASHFSRRFRETHGMSPRDWVTVRCQG